MNRIELLEDFAARINGFLLPADRDKSKQVMPDKRTAVVEGYRSLDENHALSWEILWYWDDDANTVKNAHIWVKDKGKETEEAVWQKGQDPKPAPKPATFADDVRSYLDGKIQDGTIVHYSGLSADASTERATVVVVLDVSGTLTKKEVGIWRKGGAFQYEVIEV